MILSSAAVGTRASYPCPAMTDSPTTALSMPSWRQYVTSKNSPTQDAGRSFRATRHREEAGAFRRWIPSQSARPRGGYCRSSGCKYRKSHHVHPPISGGGFMNYLRVRNWDKWQYRSDRNLPWIKVYRDLLLDPDFIQLSDIERGHLVSIWMAASAKNGCIPDDAKAVQRLISSEIKPDLERFLSLQFLENTGKRRRRNGAPNREDIGREDPPLPPQEINGSRFAPPTVDEVREYAASRESQVDADKFHDFYTSKGWMIGKNKMKDWRAAVRTWESKDPVRQKVIAR